MSQILASMILLAGAHFAAMLSPGPTFLIVLRRATQSQAVSLVPLVAGIAAATFTNSLLTILGIAALIAASPRTALVLSILGAIYLVYLGASNIITGLKKFRNKQDGGGSVVGQRSDERAVSGFSMFRDGYLVNLLNPKSAVFHISIFSQVASPSLPNSVLFVFGGQLVLQSALFWTAFVAFSRAGIIQRAINKGKGWVDIAFGVAIVSFALYLLWGGL